MKYLTSSGYGSSLSWLFVRITHTSVLRTAELGHSEPQEAEFSGKMFFEEDKKTLTSRKVSVMHSLNENRVMENNLTCPFLR